jgi:hypothetical protein
MLKKYLPEGKIMTRWARTAFYAERDWADINSRENIPELLATARKSNVSFLLVDQMAISNCPGIAPLFTPARELLNEAPPSEPQVKYFENLNYQPYPGIQLYMLYRDPKRVVAAIYQILPESK